MGRPHCEQDVIFLIGRYWDEITSETPLEEIEFYDGRSDGEGVDLDATGIFDGEEVTANSERQQRIEELAEVAEEEGERQHLETRNESCSNPRAECNMDKVEVFVTENGETVEERYHMH